MKKTIKAIWIIPLVWVIVGCSTTGVDDVGGWESMPQSGVYGEKYMEYEENPFQDVSEKPISTFSIDADGAAYANMRRYVNLGQRPPKESVRIEEFINYFTFDYAEPPQEESISLNSEVARCPWNDEHLLLRVGVKGKTIIEDLLPPSNYVFLIDVSGSMNSPDKLGILKTGFKTMVDNLKDNDKVAIVIYAGRARVLLNSTSADQKEVIQNAINELGAGGSTAGHDGISKAYEIAKENFIEGGNNRIILGSDGDFNTGPSSVKELIELVESKKDEGIFITVLGVGGGNLNDHMAEQIANKGNGTYEYIDNAEQIEKVFVNERSKFYAVAKDVKLQLTFNKDAVKSYRLIGYENRLLENQDFEDDEKDAGEIGVGQTITAMYEIIPATISKKNAAISLGSFDARYKKVDEDTSYPLSIKLASSILEIDKSSENMRFAAAITAYGLILKESQYKGSADMQMVSDLSDQAISFDPYGYRKGFIDLVNKLK